MGCGCAGSEGGREAPPARPPRAGEPSPPAGSSQGAMGTPGYYYTGPARPPQNPPTKSD